MAGGDHEQSRATLIGSDETSLWVGRECYPRAHRARHLIDLFDLEALGHLRVFRNVRQIFTVVATAKRLCQGLAPNLS
jgi:hypothetical protein